MSDNVDHPSHYGGEDNPYEVIKVIDAWGLGFRLGNVLKYIGRPAKGQYLEDLKKARWYLDQEILKRERAEKTVQVQPGVTYVVGAGGGGGGNPGGGDAYPRGYGGGGGPYQAQGIGGSSATKPRCNGSWGCVHGYHGRQCPLFKDIP